MLYPKLSPQYGRAHPIIVLPHTHTMPPSPLQGLDQSPTEPGLPASSAKEAEKAARFPAHSQLSPSTLPCRSFISLLPSINLPLPKYLQTRVLFAISVGAWLRFRGPFLHPLSLDVHKILPRPRLLHCCSKASSCLQSHGTGHVGTTRL